MHLQLYLFTFLIIGAFGFAINDSQSLLWAPYRSNLYFGLRPIIPQSLLTGLMWFGTNNYDSFSQLRHACEQGDGLATYTWTKYDAREGGIQILSDPINNVNITTEFLKISGGEHGGSWAARIKGEPFNPELPSRTSFIFYFGLEGLGGVNMDSEVDSDGIEGPIDFSGSTPELGSFKISVVDGPNNLHVEDGPYFSTFASRIGKTHFLGTRSPTGQIWRAKDLLSAAIVTHARPIIESYKESANHIPDASYTLQFPDEILPDSNLYGVQKFFDGDFQFDIFFESDSAKQKLNSVILDNGIEAFKEKYDRRFQEIFTLPPDTPLSLVSFAQSITSNLLGGIGYFYGNSLVDRTFRQEWDQDDDLLDTKRVSTGAQFTESKSLLTATPSRSFFPRGFYWDEGFHLLHIGAWDSDLSLAILKDWIDLIDEDGWVAREQILGDEARSKVPPEFITQIPAYANPPTLTMAVTAFIERFRSSSELSMDELGMNVGINFDSHQAVFESDSEQSNTFLESRELALQYLTSIYPALKRHYEWFRRTQRGQIKQYGRKARSRTEAYRWRGRSTQHVLTSGMDDYPRGPPHSGELHLDLISWMAFFTRTMREISSFIDQTEDEESFKEIEQAILGNIEDLHWSEEDQMYCDVGVNSDDESIHICHKGYLSLFPFLLGLLPSSSPHLGAILDILYDPDHLWSPYGIRSLSASHSEFGQGENYWKGPIWIQMNYLALSSLYKYYIKEPGPFKAKASVIYQELRQNIVENVFKEYERTGYVWEQYDALSGEGRRSHPFTGWTSLVALILAEKY